MIKRTILTKEVKDIKISVVWLLDIEILDGTGFEVAIITADDVIECGRYATEEEALKKAEELEAQATIETMEVTIVSPVLTAHEFTAIMEAYDVSEGYIDYVQKLMMGSISGALSKSVVEYMTNMFGHYYDDNITHSFMADILELTMYQYTKYDTEFKKFFTYWKPKSIA